jgi:hypothetical protein
LILAADENLPLPKDEYPERLKKTVESSKLPENLKERFLVSIMDAEEK